jgi:2-oxo-4-hydroxy-4-carboxy-5-ureidoimidazoline decarboxylase
MINLEEAVLRGRLSACLDVPRWIDTIVEKAPYESLDDLMDVARLAADPLTHEEISHALAHHPRVGEGPAGDGLETDFSRLQHSVADQDDPALATEIALARKAYEQRFGRAFLIRAVGRSRAEVAAELQRRLELDDETELEVVGEQLREIALLRIEESFYEDG